jgi:hypothetical protein
MRLKKRYDPIHQYFGKIHARCSAPDTASQGIASDVNVGVNESGRHNEVSPVNYHFRLAGFFENCSFPDGDNAVALNCDSAIPDDMAFVIHGDDRRAFNQRVNRFDARLCPSHRRRIQ